MKKKWNIFNSGQFWYIAKNNSGRKFYPNSKDRLQDPRNNIADAFDDDDLIQLVETKKTKGNENEIANIVIRDVCLFVWFELTTNKLWFGKQSNLLCTPTNNVENHLFVSRKKNCC